MGIVCDVFSLLIPSATLPLCKGIDAEGYALLCSFLSVWWFMSGIVGLVGGLQPQYLIFGKICHSVCSSQQVLWFMSGIVVHGRGLG